MSYTAQRREMAEKLRQEAKELAAVNGSSREPKVYDAGRAQGMFEAADFVERYQEEDED